MNGTMKLGAGCSLGALLAVPVSAQADDYTVTTLADDLVTPPPGSLRAAIEEANTTPEADRILFQSKLSGEITLDGDQIIVGDDLEIIGPGARRLAIDGGGLSRIFYIGYVDVAISGLTLSGGRAESDGGGAIFISQAADLEIASSTISGNSTPAQGGGIRNYTAANLTVRNSTISGNAANGYEGGGGLYSENANVTVINSTISDNETTRDGGGIYIGNEGGSATIRNSTITGNHADDRGGGLYFYSPTELVGTIVANNTADSQGDEVNGDAGEFEGAFNLVEGSTNFDLAGSGNILGVDPKLKPLKNNGGPTDTHAFKKSPAKNKVPKAESETSDQRGVKRKGKGDIGAYELVKCKGVIVNIVGTAGKDKLKGTRRKDGILGLGGNDKLSGKKGKDGLCGGKGKDKLKGGPGKDKLDGGPGKDKEVQ